MRRRQATGDERRSIAFHEVGHMAMVYWRNESMHSFRAVLHADRFGGSFYRNYAADISESDLMVLIGGPMAEFLSMGIKPEVVLRFSNEHRHPNSDSTRMRNCIRFMRGKDDRSYQLEVQERVRAIMQEPRMWLAITKLAEHLDVHGELTGEYAERTFEEYQVPTLFGGARW